MPPASRAAAATKDLASLSIEKMGWTVGKFLGEGAFGKVYLVSKGGLTAACKIIEKPKEKSQLDMIYNEISLFDKIVELGSFTEQMAAGVSVKVLIALRYVHAQGIVHRDLKPENLLLATKEANSPVKLVDFGLSAMYDAESAMMTDPAGTPGYQAPEVLTSRKNGGYDQQVDVWSFGVIIYILLSGTPPFFAPTAAKETAKIIRADYTYPPAQWANVTQKAKNFINRMLVVDPKERATVDQLLQDPWLQDALRAHQAADGKTMAGIELPPAGAAAGPNLKASEGYDLKATEAALAAQAKFASTWMKMKSVMALQAAGRRAAGGGGGLAGGLAAAAKAEQAKPAEAAGGAATKYAANYAAKPTVDISDDAKAKSVKFANSPGKPPPLPRGWSAHISKAGDKYWYSCDADSKLVQWEVPTEAQAVEMSLPAGWTAHKAKDGKRFFYWCATSQQTIWEIPGPERAVQTKLPRGWTAHVGDDKVHFYYFCASNGKTQWEVPELWQATAKPQQPKAPPTSASNLVQRKSSNGIFVRRVSTARPAVRQWGR